VFDTVARPCFALSDPVEDETCWVECRVNWILDTIKTVGGGQRSYDLSIRTPFYHPDFPVIIMWSEKAACTVIAKWFFHHIGLLDDALGHARWIHEYENEVFKSRADYKRDCLAAIKSGKPIIKFTRNPYARAYSGYLETCNKRVLHHPDHWSTKTRASILETLTGSSTELEHAYSFVQFSQWMADQPAHALDMHIAPQMTQIEQELNVDVVQLESLENGLPDMEARLGLPSSLGIEAVHTSSHHHKKTTANPVLGSRILEVGLPVTRRPEFNLFDIKSNMIAASAAGPALRAIFGSDFEAYGYDDAA